MGTENEWKIYVVAWICCMVAVCIGIYFTQSVWCMLVLILPVMLGNSDAKKKKKEDGEK